MIQIFFLKWIQTYCSSNFLASKTLRLKSLIHEHLLSYLLITIGINNSNGSSNRGSNMLQLPIRIYLDRLNKDTIIIWIKINNRYSPNKTNNNKTITILYCKVKLKITPLVEWWLKIRKREVKVWDHWFK